MRLVKTVQTLTLSTVFVLVLSACHQKENHATNTTTQTGSVMQEEGVDGTGSGVGSAAGTGSTDTANNHTTQQSVNNAMPNSSNVSSEANHPNAQPTETTSNNGNTSTGDGDHNGTDSGTDDGNSTAGGSGTDDNATDGGTNSNAATLQSLNLKIATTTLNRDHSTTITPKATYDDNTTKTPTNIEWIINPKDAVSIEGNTLIAKQDTNVTIQAKVGNILSNKVHLNIYWEVDGHRLPPEPAPKINNATLLGVDVNNNGVRDDVERWIYKTYKEYIPCRQELDWNNTVVINGKTIPSAVQVCEDHPVPYHPVVRAVAMQGARAAQIIIQEPEKARETTKLEDSAQDCEFYLDRISKELNNSSLSVKHFSIKEFDKIQYNTVQRARAYAKYNFYLSGGIYSVPATEEEEMKGCNKEVKALLKELR